MKRRDFLRRLGLGLAGAWALGRVSRPWPTLAATAPSRGLRLAFLSDAHLQDGDERRPEARALARAVAELRRLDSGPDMVLFAGDLAHNGDPRALALGREILTDLPAPCLMIMGEGDGLPDGAGAWRRLFGEPWFSFDLRGTENEERKTVLQILGLHTAWCPGPGGPLFRVGESGRRRLAQELARCDPEIPLLLLSHAPLEPIFRPWQQWTMDGPEVLGLLAPFRQVLCVHGHVHNTVASCRLPVLSEGKGRGDFAFSENRLFSSSLPATAWPKPQAVQGTPAQLAPGLGPAGCGWLLLTTGRAGLQFQPQIWQG